MRMESDFVIHCGRLYERSQSALLHFSRSWVAVWFVSRYFGRDYSGNFTNESWRIFEKEIFVPLEMEDTGFYVPIEKQERFAELYRRTESGLKVEKERYLGLTLCLEKPSFESGGAGLVSTLEDYSHFANMLAGGGLWNQTRILKRESIQQFTKIV